MVNTKLIKEQYKNELLSKDNVVGVGVGFKKIGGIKTNELSVVVSVSQKVPVENLSADNLVPDNLEGIKTDVVEIGLLEALNPGVEKFRPAPGGISIGHPDITAGTLGIVFGEPGSSALEGESFASISGVAIAWPIGSVVEKLGILSNNHVLANCNAGVIGDPIYQPGVHDGGGADDTIALLSKFIPIDFNGGYNKVDCALAEPINPADVINGEILEIGQVSGTTEVQLGMSVRKYGRTTQLTAGVVEQIYATVNVQYAGGKIATFEDQIVTGYMADGGDSGSLLVEGAGQRAVGLLFAGSPSITIYNRIADVEEALGIKL